MPSQTIQCTAGADQGGPQPWLAANNITVDDGTMATTAQAVFNSAPAVTNKLNGVFSGFTIPASALLVGLVLTVRRMTSDAFSILDSGVFITISGVESGNDKSDVNGWSDTPEVINYGGASDKWGSAVTVADLNAGNVGVDLTAANSTSPTSAFQNGWFLTAYYINTHALIMSTDG